MALGVSSGFQRIVEKCVGSHLGTESNGNIKNIQDLDPGPPKRAKGMQLSSTFLTERGEMCRKSTPHPRRTGLNWQKVSLLIVSALLIKVELSSQPDIRSLEESLKDGHHSLRS